MTTTSSGVRLRSRRATALVDAVASLGDPAVTALVEACLHRTPERAFVPQPDGTTAVLTGDIPAMWLRDASIQAGTYLRFTDDADLQDVLAGVVARLTAAVVHDPYANAVNLGPTGASWDASDGHDDPWVWERKYEIDSLAHVLDLLGRWWRTTGRTDVLGEAARAAVATALEILELERDHAASSYRFTRDTHLTIDTLGRGGLGSPVAVTGMSWTGFRPSDDACTFHFTSAGNLFAAAALERLAPLARAVWADEALAARCVRLATGLRDATLEHAVVDDPHHGRVLAYEVDGLGGTLLADDPNSPSLLGLPLLGALPYGALYAATRTLVLSGANPWYYAGVHAAGLGSPHTEPGYVWPIGLVAAALTGTADDRRATLGRLARTDGGTGHVHESFHVDDPSRWTREWFSWGDCTLVDLAAAVATDRGRLVADPLEAP
ncbi:glycoside hydrolase family 125 protein [Lapillicoccus jejuensis]|uniref:Metal-independent alpha-mannosidase n=1 Tax=Lapillicoccus jejuensis TaxID=402171 RepID=A0A542E092_9MICO|nr:glycoside hydrolase family 125 protein [Lapillicoccus jejuensis]TQJ08726.1 hypothetical protein FB458_1818 [Lapillicoccus jejuensis]